MQPSLPFIPFCLMTLYATGAHRAEAAHLKISDIDSQRVVIPIRSGRGRKDRDVMLSPKVLEALHVYWRGLRRKPTDWPFPGKRWHTVSYRVSPRSSGRPVSGPPNAPVLSTSTSIPRLWPATLFDAASDPLATAFKKRLPRTTNDVCHFLRRPAHALCVCFSCPLIVSASRGLSTTLRCRITSEPRESTSLPNRDKAQTAASPSRNSVLLSADVPRERRLRVGF